MGFLSKLFKPKTICHHDWQELPWFLEKNETYHYAGCLTDVCYHHRLAATYVCAKCGKRMEKTLSHGHTEYYQDHLDVIEQIRRQSGDKLKPKYVVEAMATHAALNSLKKG